jgi:hypothetical protein
VEQLHPYRLLEVMLVHHSRKTGGEGASVEALETLGYTAVRWWRNTTGTPPFLPISRNTKFVPFTSTDLVVAFSKVMLIAHLSIIHEIR